jgi:hypothetical protein
LVVRFGQKEKEMRSYFIVNQYLINIFFGFCLLIAVQETVFPIVQTFTKAKNLFSKPEQKPRPMVLGIKMQPLTIQRSGPIPTVAVLDLTFRLMRQLSFSNAHLKKTRPPLMEVLKRKPIAQFGIIRPGVGPDFCPGCFGVC